MANNRLYIRCKACKESMMVTKCLGGPYQLDSAEVKKLNAFLYDHWACSEETAWGGGEFEIYDEYSEEVK